VRYPEGFQAFLGPDTALREGLTNYARPSSEFGRLDGYGLRPLRVRGLARVQLHADLIMLARLALALTRARAVPLAA
jgi:hypothetical protein